jgi:trehalose 6-phosphate phosphatase
MNNILSRSGLEVLKQFAWSNGLLAFDYDGTLAPIVPDPERAAMRKSTRELLDELTRLYPVIVVSGRAQADVRKRLKGVPVREVVGNHGLEPWHAAGRFAERVQRWKSFLQEKLRSFKGVAIEDKNFSLAIHYRHCREKKRAKAEILKAVSQLKDIRIIGGKCVVNLLPSQAPHKGLALVRQRKQLQCDTAIFVGDDETDEDVFALDQPGRLLGIRVGPRPGSLADYCLNSQTDIDDLLYRLIELRSPGKRLAHS